MEYGIFTDEGCIEDGFYSLAAADERARAWYRVNGEDVEVYEICPDHPETAKHSCEECLGADEGQS
jgi:hypothetical protein